ncbi:MAG: ATP-binding protein [Verrucomicrobia bacterium]|nr:ATP-binding protein [Verrucomicrobiota bacterium]
MAQLPALPSMLEMIRHEAERVGFEEPEVKQIELVAEEVLVNIITHGYSGQGSGDVEIESEPLGRGKLKLIIRDHGPAFNPLEQKKKVDCDAPLEERSIGGLGLFFMERLMNEVTYTREDDTNILTLVKLAG